MKNDLVKVPKKNKNSIVGVDNTALVLSTEDKGMFLESKFASALGGLSVDCIESVYKKIMAFNIITERQFSQNLLCEHIAFSYISDIPNSLLVDNNIYLGEVRMGIIHATIYIIIDASVKDIDSYILSFNASDELLRIYINISNYMAYSSVDAYIRNAYPDAEIISLNNPPETFNPSRHIEFVVKKSFTPWITPLPDKNEDGLIPFINFAERSGYVVREADSCLYSLLDNKQFHVKRETVEVVGYRASELLLQWNPHIKTINEHYYCCSAVTNYLCFLKHFDLFAGYIKRVTLDIQYEENILADDEPDIILSKGMTNIMREPTDEECLAAIKKHPRYSREKLFVLDNSDRLCFVQSVALNMELLLTNPALVKGNLDIVKMHDFKEVILLTPLNGVPYEKGMKSQFMVAPDVMKQYIIRSNGAGTGFWAPWNMDHVAVLEGLLELYTIDKLIKLGIYNPTTGFTAPFYTLNMKDTRWFE